jgi:MFS family permease
MSSAIGVGARNDSPVRSPARPPGDPAPGRVRRRLPLRRWHPLLAVCVVQAALSMSFIWSNTAFTDEAEYLWGGHLQLAHWLHGTPLPAVLTHTFSGSPMLYPPIGALADSIGGLAGARLVSLAFMIGATVFLYRVAEDLLGRTAALFAVAVWVIGEPVMRLGAFATYDALSILLTAASAWLAVQAGRRRHRGEFVAAAAVALALANATAYSGVVIDPVVIAFAFLAWLPAMGGRQARFCAGWFGGALVICFVTMITLSRSWDGFLFTIVFRGTSSGFVDNTSTAASILGSVWAYTGACLVLATAGIIVACYRERGPRRGLIVLLGAAALLVPAAQLYNFTSVSLDKHLAYGLWFAALAAGYGSARILASLSPSGITATVLCCGLALGYPAADGWQAAWYKQHSWGDASSFIPNFQRVLARTGGQIDASTQSYVAMYYARQGQQWQRWNKNDLTLSPRGVPDRDWASYYAGLLRRDDYGTIALFYTTSLHGVPTGLLLSSRSSFEREQLLKLVAINTGSKNSPVPGLPALTVDLEKDSQYRLAAIGPYSTITINGAYAIWQKKADR